MSCDCPASPDSDTPDTLSAQLTALVNTLFGGSTITVVGDRPVFASCFSEAELTNVGGVLCALKEAFEAATGATTDSVEMVQYSCLPVELTPVAENVQINPVVWQAVPEIPYPIGTTTFIFDDGEGNAATPATLGIEVGMTVVDSSPLMFPPGTRVESIFGPGVVFSQPSLAVVTGGDTILLSKLVAAPCTLGSWICWVSDKLVGLESWKTETYSSLQGFVLQQVGDATASMGTAIYNLQVGQAALAASNASLQSQVAGLQTAYNSLLARVTALETLTSSQGTTLSGKADASTVVTLAGQVSTLTSEVANKLGVPVNFDSIYWTSGSAGVGASKLLADGAWHTIDIRKGFDNTTGTGIGTGLPKYVLLGVATLAAQGGIEVAFSPATGTPDDLFRPTLTYALGSHSAGAKVTIPVLVPVTGAANPAPVEFKYKITTASSAHYETEISLLAAFF